MNTIVKNFLAGLFVLTLSCGAPTGPAPPAWQNLASFEGGRFEISAIAADGDAIFFPFRENESEVGPTIRRYRDGRIEDVFTVDLKGAVGAVFYDIAVGHGAGWAVGGRAFKNGAEYRLEPLIVHYDGRAWREIPLGGRLPPGALAEVALSDADSCWLLLAEDEYGGSKPSTLWKYDGGVLKEFPGVIADAVVCDAGTGTTFALVLKDGVQIFVSADEGVTWLEEGLKPETPWPNYEPDRISACTANGVTYVATTDSDGDLIASTVYRRVGPPGAGKYELVLYCPVGPNFGEIESVAADGRGRVLAVGKWTSAYYDGLNWVQESLPEKNHFYDVTATATGFYAVASDEQWNLEILYHP